MNFKDYLVDYARKWVHISPYALTTPGSSDPDIIAAVMNSVPYRNGHVGGGVDPNGTIHGPYRIECISPQDYEPMAAGDAIERFNRWVATHTSDSAALTVLLSAEVRRRLSEADAVYVLRDLGDSAVCDYGRIHDEFNEFLTIDRASGNVAVIVASDD
ncbi:hypothetical protein [Nocardia sp. NPDC003354]